MKSATSTNILDTGKFVKFPEGYKTSKNYVPKRVPIPIEVQALVTGSLAYDKRRQGEKPPKLDMFTQLVELGYHATQSMVRTEGKLQFTDDELEVPTFTQDVIWIPQEQNDGLQEILEAYNTSLDAAGKKRLRGVVPIVCAMLRRGAHVAPKTEI